MKLEYKAYSLFKALKIDWRASAGNIKSQFVVSHYRVANWLRTYSRTTHILGVPYFIYYKFFIEWVIGVEIPCSTKIGLGLVIHHGTGTVVNPKSVIGERCCLLHQVTIGTKGDGDSAETPIIGDDVVIGVGAKILGDVHIGNGARIGAATLVLKDVPSGMIAIGNPMKIIEKK